MKKFRIYAGGKQITIEADEYKQVGYEVVFFKNKISIGQVILEKSDVVIEESAVKFFATF